MERRNKSRLRERMYELISESNAHPTADWVYMRLKRDFPRLSLGTVYRNLSILIEQGRLEKLPHGSTFDRYEADRTPHYHLICQSCGRIQDFAMHRYEQINRRARTQTDFDIAGHRINFYGICRECNRKMEQGKESS
jgi:Fe2+ or Zn2+ uptake regulation protein